MTLIFGQKKLLEGFNVRVNYQFNLMDHVGVIARAGDKEDDNTPSFPTGRGVKRGDQIC